MESETTVICHLDGSSIDIEQLDKTFDAWHESGHSISVCKCPPDGLMAQTKLRSSTVYRMRRHVRGRAVFIFNTGYLALRLLKETFTQMNYIMSSHTEKTSEDVMEMLIQESERSENQHIDSFILVIYGTIDGLDLCKLASVLDSKHLQDKPKLIYTICGDTLIQQVKAMSSQQIQPDIFFAATGFNGMLFFIYAMYNFFHELSVEDIWRVIKMFADYHGFSSSVHSTLTKEFFFFPGLVASELPGEIENLSAAELKLYLEMLEHGEVETYNIRLMFVGLYGAGKTCTARRIMGQDITDVRSTDGIDVYIGKCKVDLDTQLWTTVDDPLENLPLNALTRCFANDLRISHDDDHLNTDHVSSLDQSKHIGGEKSLIDSVNTETTEQPPKKQKVEGHIKARRSSAQAVHDTSESKETHSDALRTAHRVIHHTKHTSGNTTAEARVSLWDFAGQFEYYATHQLFFSPRCIYLLVLNMKEELDSSLQDWHLDSTGSQAIQVQGGVNFWLQSLYTYTRSNTPGVPPIILVGTHKDLLDGPEDEKQAAAEDYFMKVRSILGDSPIAKNINDRTFLLDNKNPDASLEALKDCVLDISKTLPYWGERVPARWVELEQALDDRRRDGVIVISIDELKKVNESLVKALPSEAHLKLFLRVNHEMGNLVFFEDHDAKDLCNTIVLNPQWITHAFRYLICAKDFVSKYGILKGKWEQFNETGQLDITLAKAIWKQDQDNQFLEYSDILLKLLEKLDIVVRGSVINENGRLVRKLDFFYVPCLLTETPDENLFRIQVSEECVSSHLMCLAFRDQFLPPAVFNRLVAVCLGKWPVARQGKKRLIYCGYAVFEVNRKGEDKHRLNLFFRNANVGVRITRYSTRGVKTTDRNICDRVRRTIAVTIKKEYQRFRRRESNEEEPFIYQIQCRQSTSCGDLTDGMHTKASLVACIEDRKFCEEHHDFQDAHLVDAIGMLQEWFPDEMPEAFRKTERSLLDTWFESLADNVLNQVVKENILSKMTAGIGTNWQLLMVEQFGLTTTMVERIAEVYPQRTSMAVSECLYSWLQTGYNNGERPTYRDLLVALKGSKVSTVDWDTVRNVIDDLMMVH